MKFITSPGHSEQTDRGHTDNLTNVVLKAYYAAREYLSLLLLAVVMLVSRTCTSSFVVIFSNCSPMRHFHSDIYYNSGVAIFSLHHDFTFLHQ